MNTCDTCKWWESRGDGVLPEYGGPSFFMVCGNPKNGINALNHSDACAVDAYQEHATGLLMPGPKFGCIHHQPKP